MLETEIQYFESNQATWMAEFPGRFVVVKDTELLGAFDSFDDALAEATRRYGISQPFLIRRVDFQDEAVCIPALTLGVLCADPECAHDGAGEVA